jgi:hypothetical protein
MSNSHPGPTFLGHSPQWFWLALSKGFGSEEGAQHVCGKGKEKGEPHREGKQIGKGLSSMPLTCFDCGQEHGSVLDVACWLPWFACRGIK